MRENAGYSGLPRLVPPGGTRLLVKLSPMGGTTALFTTTLIVVNSKGEQCFYLSLAEQGGNKKKIGGTSRGNPLYLFSL